MERDRHYTWIFYFSLFIPWVSSIQGKKEMRVREREIYRKRDREREILAQAAYSAIHPATLVLEDLCNVQTTVVFHQDSKLRNITVATVLSHGIQSM